jgi:hypothetical protein
MTIQQLVLDRIEGKEPDHKHDIVECPECREQYCVVCIPVWFATNRFMRGGNRSGYQCPLCGAWVIMDSGTNGRGHDILYNTTYRRE